MARHLLLAGTMGLLMALLSACAGSRDVPSPTPGYKVGKPYVVNGKRYVPRVDPNYRATGVASWYGDEFHGRRTANGEIFNKNALTAAHTTLPLPVNVRVTNLENNRSLILRVNDRGPFARDRIIDVSREAAKELGFLNKGVARVRVEYVSLAPLAGSLQYADTGSLEMQSADPPTATIVAVDPWATPLIVPARKPQVQLAFNDPKGATPPETQSRPAAKPQSISGIETASFSQAEKPRPVAAGMFGSGHFGGTETERFFITSVFDNPLDAELARQDFGELGSVDVKASSGALEIYTVKVGPFATEKEARSSIEHLKNRGYENTVLLSE